MYKRILIIVDERPVSRVAIKEGTAIAKTHGAEVLFFHMMPRYSAPLSDMPPFVMVSPHDFQRAARTTADKLLSAATASAEKAGVMARSGRGSAQDGEDDAHCVAEAARRWRCDLIVAASEGRNALLRLLTGSIIPGLITASPVPVLVVKDNARQKAGARAAVVPIRPRRAAKQAVASARLQRGREVRV